jgi:hypothetical protein
MVKFKVLVIGFKFYPILAVADMKQNLLSYGLGFIYVSVIWFIKVVNKGFCRRSEAFLKFTLDKISDQIKHNKLLGIDHNINSSSSMISVYDDESRYRTILKNKIPNIFDKFFGNRTVPNDDFFTKFTISQQLTSTIPAMTTTKMGFRKKIFNKTFSYTNEMMENYLDDDTPQDGWATIRSLLENLPLYISLSYLVGRYLLSFLGKQVGLFLQSSSKS